jgi:hypothetical protein
MPVELAYLSILNLSPEFPIGDHVENECEHENAERNSTQRLIRLSSIADLDILVDLLPSSR